MAWNVRPLTKADVENKELMEEYSQLNDDVQIDLGLLISAESLLTFIV